MSQHCYLIKSVVHPTLVQHVVAGAFSRPGASEHVLVKRTVLELVVLSEDGSLHTTCEQPMLGCACGAQLLPWNEEFRTPSMPKALAGCDFLVLLSDSLDLAIVAFQRKLNRFTRICSLDLRDEGFSITRPPASLAIDPESRAVAVAADSQHVALFYVTGRSWGSSKLIEGARTNTAPPGVGNSSWDAIVSMTFVRPQAEDMEKGLLKLALVVRSDDSPGHEVLILHHDTRDQSTHPWARLPPSVNVCPFSSNFLHLTVLAPPKMPDTLLLARTGDLVVLDLSFKGPVAKAAWPFPRKETESEAVRLGALDLATDAQTSVRQPGRNSNFRWELDLQSPDADKARLSKRRARFREDPTNEVSLADWNEESTETKAESSSILHSGPSICSYAWRSDGSDTCAALVVNFEGGGLQALELRRNEGVDGHPDVKLLQVCGCDASTCQPCGAVVWLGEKIVGAFERSGDGHVMKLEADGDMSAVASVKNAAPIVDFQLVDHFEEKQDQLFACCGEGPSSSLRVIRAGIGAEHLLSTPPAYKGVTGTWAMRMSADDSYHSFLVMSFVSGSRVLSVGLSFDDVTESVGFQQHASTLACGPIIDCHVVQICAQAVYLCMPTRKAHPSGIDSDQPLVATWHPPNSACISVGAVSTEKIVVGLSRPSSLVMLGVEKGAHVALVHLHSCRTDAELSCISLQHASLADVTMTSATRDFAAQVGSVCVLGTYAPSVEVRSVCPEDGFLLLASVPLAEGTAFLQSGISPEHSSDVRLAAALTSSCVPESVLLSFYDRGYLLLGLRNGLLARYEWPTEQIGRVLSTVSQARHQQEYAQSLNGETLSGASTSRESRSSINDRTEVSQMSVDSCTNTARSAIDEPASPVALAQVGEKRMGSAPVSLIRLFPEGASNLTESAPSESASEASASMYTFPNTFGGASTRADVFSDVLALSNRPWLLHRSATGFGRMMTSAISHPTSAHATALSCRECPQGIVFMTECCMHLVELDASKKSNVRDLPCPGCPRRLVYHPPSQTLIVLCTMAPVDSTGRSYTMVRCIDPETGFVHSEYPIPPHYNEHGVSVSLWGGGSEGRSNPLIVVGTSRSLIGPSESEGSLLDAKNEPYQRGNVDLFRLCPEASEAQSRLRLQFLHQREMPGPVLATCQFTNGPHGADYLAVAAGRNLFFFAVMDAADLRLRLKQVARTRTRFPVVSVSSSICPVSGAARLVVGDSQDGILVYGLTSGVRRLELLFAERERRALSDAFGVSDSLGVYAIGTDSEGGIAVTSAERRPPNSKSPEHNLDVMAWFNLGDRPMRVRPGRLGSAEPPDLQLRQTPPDNRGQIMVVGTASGGVVSLERLAPHDYELLLLVQQSLAMFEGTAPLLGNAYASFRAKGSTAKAKPMLEADLLKQFLDLPESMQETVLQSARPLDVCPIIAATQHWCEQAGVPGAVVLTRMRQIVATLIENI